MNHKSKLDEKDREIMDSCKAQLDIHVNILKESGIRYANIEIELIHYIKRLLKDEVDY